MENRKLVIYLHGGLGDQLRKYFAGLYLSKLSKRSLLFNTSLQHEWHLGDTSSLSSLFGNLPLENDVYKVTNRSRDLLKRYFHSSIARGTIENLFSYFEDYDNSTFQNTVHSEAVIAKLKKWSRRPTVRINGYFPTFMYFREILKEGNLTFKLGNVSYYSKLGCVVHFRIGDNFLQDSIVIRDYSYYQKALELVTSRIPGIEFFGVADNITKARKLYDGLNITWVEESDKWDSYKLFSVLSTAAYFVSSQSGISIWALALNPHRKFSILPQVSTNSELGLMLETGDFSNSVFVDSTSL